MSSTQSEQIKELMKKEISRLQMIYDQFNEQITNQQQPLSGSQLESMNENFQRQLLQTIQQQPGSFQNDFAETQKTNALQSFCSNQFNQKNVMQRYMEQASLNNSFVSQSHDEESKQFMKQLLSQNNKPSHQINEQKSNFNLISQELHQNHLRAVQELKQMGSSHEFQLTPSGQPQHFAYLQRNQQVYQQQLQALMKQNQIKSNPVLKKQKNNHSFILNHGKSESNLSLQGKIASSAKNSMQQSSIMGRQILNRDSTSKSFLKQSFL